jgi:hypothetical protein
MMRRAPAFAVAALLGSAPLLASAAEQARPLRTLTYAVDISINESLDMPPAQSSGGSPPVVIMRGGRTMNPRPQGPTGSGQRHAIASVSATGSITVDVIQATDDAGLVVDIAEDAPKRARPKVRVGVAGDGALLYDPKDANNLSEEEMAVIRWLARGFYGDHPTDIGTAWIVDQSSGGHTDIERYRVLSHDASRVTLGYALEERTTVAGGYTGTREGSLVYDTALVIPVKATFDGVARRQVGDTFNTLRTSVRLTLTADSFVKVR